MLISSDRSQDNDMEVPILFDVGILCKATPGQNPTSSTSSSTNTNNSSATTCTSPTTSTSSYYVYKS